MKTYILVKLVLTTILCVSFLGIRFLSTCISYTRTHKHLIYICIHTYTCASFPLFVFQPNFCCLCLFSFFFVFASFFNIPTHTHTIHNTMVVRGDSYIHTYIDTYIARQWSLLGTLPLGHMGLGQRSAY